jgi:hypothetical protein
MQVLPMVLGGLVANTTFFTTAASVIGAFGSVAAGRYQAGVANNNAKIAENNEAKATNEAAIAAQIQDQEATQDIGSILSEQGASGLDVGVGSGALRRKSASELAARDRGFTIFKGQSESDAYKQQAEGFRSDAKVAKRSGILEAGTSLLSMPNFLGDAKRVGKTTTSIRPRRNPAY